MNRKFNLLRGVSIVLSVLSLILQNLSLFDVFQINDFSLFIITWVLPGIAVTFAISSLSKLQSKKDIFALVLAFITLFYSILFVVIAWMFADNP